MVPTALWQGVLGSKMKYMYTYSMASHFTIYYANRYHILYQISNIKYKISDLFIYMIPYI